MPVRPWVLTLPRITHTQTGKVQLDAARDIGLTESGLDWAGGIPTLPLAVNVAITVGVFAVIEKWRAEGEEIEGLPAIFPNGAQISSSVDKMLSVK